MVYGPKEVPTVSNKQTSEGGEGLSLQVPIRSGVFVRCRFVATGLSWGVPELVNSNVSTQRSTATCSETASSYCSRSKKQIAWGMWSQWSRRFHLPGSSASNPGLSASPPGEASSAVRWRRRNDCASALDNTIIRRGAAELLLLYMYTVSLLDFSNIKQCIVGLTLLKSLIKDPQSFTTCLWMDFIAYLVSLACTTKYLGSHCCS